MALIPEGRDFFITWLAGGCGNSYPKLERNIENIYRKTTKSGKESSVHISAKQPHLSRCTTRKSPGEMLDLNVDSCLVGVIPLRVGHSIYCGL